MQLSFHEASLFSSGIAAQRGEQYIMVAMQEKFSAAFKLRAG